MIASTFDPSKLITLYFRRARAGTRKFIFLDSAQDPYDITGIPFELFLVRNEGSTTKLLSLTIGSGLTIGGSENNELTAAVTEVTSNINEGKYYWQLYRADTKKTWLNGDAIVHVGKFDGVTSSSESITISDGDTITVTVGESTNLPLVNATYSTALTFDYDKAMYQDVTAPTFTLASSGNVNGVGIILKLNTPTSVTFPASFTAHPNSATLDNTKLNVYTLVYYSDWDGAGTAKVVYTNSLFTAI